MSLNDSFQIKECKMETIKNYLEAMFSGLPNTAEVRKAKAELLQMMEDKYNELINEGKSENTAVGTVISEFGNLDELAEDLGLTREVNESRAKESEFPRRQVTLEQAQAYLVNNGRRSVLLALGVLLCIISVSWPIIFSVAGEMTGVILMFVSIAAGVGLIVASSFMDSEWKFLKYEPCMIDMATADTVNERRRSFEPVRTLCASLGVILCIICWIPNLFATSIMGLFAPALMFLLVGIGVFLIVYGSNVYRGFTKLLHLNDRNTIGGAYANTQDRPTRFKNKTAETIVTIYWPLVTSIYLILSFLTYRWDITWIIWPIAGVLHRVVMIACCED